MYFTTLMNYFFVYILITVKTLTLAEISQEKNSVRFAVIVDYGSVS